MLDLKGLYSPFSALKFIHIVPTIKEFCFKKEKYISFIYQSFENAFGII